MSIIIASGQAAYAVYSKAVGGTTFDDRPLPSFDQLGQRQQAAWQAVAQSAGTAIKPGSILTTKDGITGKVTSVSVTSEGRISFWRNCVDSTGRPFEHHSYIDDLVAPEVLA